MEREIRGRRRLSGTMAQLRIRTSCWVLVSRGRFELAGSEDWGKTSDSLVLHRWPYRMCEISSICYHEAQPRLLVLIFSVWVLRADP